MMTYGLYNNLILEKALRVVYFNIKSALEIAKEEYIEDLSYIKQKNLQQKNCRKSAIFL